MDVYSGFPDPILHKTSDSPKQSLSKKINKHQKKGSKDEEMNEKIDSLIKDTPHSFLDKASSYASNLGDFLFGKKVSPNLSQENQEITQKIIDIREKKELNNDFMDSLDQKKKSPSLSTVLTFIEMRQGQEALDELTGHHDESLIKEFNSEELAEKDIYQVFEQVKESESETEKVEGFGKIVGILIETIPTSIEAIESGDAVLFDRFFDSTMELVGAKGSPLVSSGIAAGGSVLLALLSTKIKDRVKFYKEKLDELENKKGSENDIKKCKLKIIKLEKYWMRTFSKLDLDTFLNEQGILSKAVETITPILPKAQKTFKDICSGGGPILEGIQIAAETILIKQRREALEILNDLKSALTREKELLIRGQQDKKTIEKIAKLEKEIELTEGKIIYQEFRFTSKSLKLIRTMIKKAAILLPGDVNLFLKLGTSLSILNNAVDIALPGRTVIQLMQKISDLRKMSESLDLQFQSIYEEIEILKNSKSSNREEDQRKIQAKENLLEALKIKKFTLNASTRNLIFKITQNLVMMSNSGVSLSKDALILLGLGKAVSVALGGIGTALLATNILLTIAQHTYVDTSSIEKWTDQRILDLENRELQDEISVFHSRIKALSEDFMDLKEIPTQLVIKRCQQQIVINENKIKELFENLRSSDNQEMKKAGKEIISLQNEQNVLLSLCIHLQDMKSETLKPSALVEMKQKMMNQLNELQIRIFAKESIQLQEKEGEIEKDFLLNRKLRPLGLDQERYAQFKIDLKKAIEDPGTYTEFSDYVKKENFDLWDKIFIDRQNPNIDLLTDFFIPPMI